MFVREGMEAMETLIAITHILGSIIALSVIGFVVFLLVCWESARNQKQIMEETAVALGIRVEDFDSEEFGPKILQMLSEKFSTRSGKIMPGSKVVLCSSSSTEKPEPDKSTTLRSIFNLVKGC